MTGDPNDLYQELRGIPLRFGPSAGLGVIDAIKRAYAQLEQDYAKRPSQIAQAGAAAAPPLAPADTSGVAPESSAPGDIPDAEIAKTYDNPVERFAAFMAKYGDNPPAEVGKHFSLLDELSMKGR